MTIHVHFVYIISYKLLYNLHNRRGILNKCYTIVSINHVGGVMVSMLSSSAVYRGFEPQSGQTRDYKIGICCFFAKHAALRSKSKE